MSRFLLSLAIGLVMVGNGLAAAPKPLPISAHNCYPLIGESNARLVEALALGIDNIEIDLGWDQVKGRLIVGHDAAPSSGSVHPTFDSYILPLLDAPARPDRAPTVLTIDWKTARPEAVAAFKAWLDAHADLLSSAPKFDPSPLTVRRFTVCFTGDERAKAAYDASIPSGGTYRAFADVVHGAGAYRDDPASYAERPATAYRRFLTFHWGVVEQGAPALAHDWTSDEAARLKAIVGACHAKGYRVRFYCLNGKGSFATIGYRFASPEAAEVRWRAASEAGVDWVASDDYAEIVRVLSGR